MSDVAELLTDGEEPGPKKSFWAHLDDLRTALLRCAIAIGLALIVCLMLGDKLVALLEYPLRRIDAFEKPKPTVTFRIGSNQLGPYPVTREQFAGLPAGDAPQVVFDIGATQIGGQQVLTLKTAPAPAPQGPTVPKPH